MEHRRSQIREPGQLQPHPTGGNAVLPLLDLGLHGGPQVLRGALDGGHTRQGQIILHEGIEVRQLGFDLGERLPHLLRAIG